MGGGFHPPESVIASWPAPNYVNPEAKGNQLLVVASVFALIAVAVVLARLWVRIRIQRNAGLDDLFIFLALIPTLGITSLLILIGTKFRWHRHIWDVPPETIPGRQYHSWIVMLLFVFSTSFSKISALLLYRRVVAGTADLLFIRVVNFAITLVVLYFIGFVLGMVLQCHPTNAYWLQFSYPEPYTKPFHCIFEGEIPMANATISVATDFLAALLPMFLFRQLRLPIREKIALSVLFGVGFVVCLFGIVRTILAHRIFYLTYDVTWVSHDLWIWTTVENDLLIICTSLPTLRCLLNRCFPNVSSLSFSDPHGLRLATLEDGNINRSKSHRSDSRRQWDSTDSLRSTTDQWQSLESHTVTIKAMVDRPKPSAQPLATLKEIFTK